jgi:hypothetical protein
MKLRNFWITGDVGDCDNQWDDLKTCFWLRQFNAADAELWEKKVKRARDIRKPPPESASGTIWAPRTKPPMGWASPGSGIPDDDIDSSPLPPPQQSGVTGAGHALQYVWGAVPPMGWLVGWGASSTTHDAGHSTTAPPATVTAPPASDYWRASTGGQ